MKNEVTASFTWPVASGANATHHLLPNGFRQNKTAVWPGAGTVTRIEVETSAISPVVWNQLTVHNCHTNYKKVPTFTVPLDADVDNGAMEVGTFSTQKLSNDNAGAPGEFTVTYRGATTAALAKNVSAADLQLALEGLSTIGAGNVVVAGTRAPTDPYRIVLRRVPGSRPFELLTITDLTGLTSTIAQLPSFNAYGSGTVTGITLASCIDWDSKAFEVYDFSATPASFVKPMTFEMCVPCPYGILVRCIAGAAISTAVRVNVTYIPGTSGWRYFNESRFALAG